MALYFKDIEITNIDNLVPQPGLDITDIWFGSTNVYTVWGTYEGTLPATLNANGDDMRQYQIYGNMGGVGELMKNLLEITQDMYNPENWGLADPYQGVVYFMYYRLPQIVIEHLQNIGTIAGTVYLKPNGSYDGEVLAITNLKGGEGTRPITNDYRLLTKNGVTLNFSKDVSAWSDIYLALGYSGGIPQDKRIIIDFLFQNYNIMLNTGSTALPYEPYGYKLDMSVKSANLFDINDLENGSISISDGTNTVNNAQKRTNGYISVMPSTRYIMSNINGGIRVHEYDAQNVWIQSTLLSNNKFITTTNNTDKIRLAGLSDSFTVNMSFQEILTTPIYIGDEPLDKDEYVDYQAGKAFRRTAQVMPSAPAESKTVNGITVTCDGDGRYSISGTATAYASIRFDIPEFTTPTSVEQGGQGTLSMFNDFANSNVALYFMWGSVSVDDWRLTPANRTNTVYSVIGNKTINAIIIGISAGVTINGAFSPMFTDNGALPETYIPYLQPTDPPVALPALPTCDGETIVDYAGQSVAIPEKVAFKYRKKNF